MAENSSNGGSDKLVTVKRYGGNATTRMTPDQWEDLNKKKPGQFVLVTEQSTKKVEKAVKPGQAPAKEDKTPAAPSAGTANTNNGKA